MSIYQQMLDAAWQKHLAARTPNAPTVISLFAGCGGSSLGYSMAGFRELLAVEWDDNAAATFRLNFPDVPIFHGDIADLSIDECLRLSGIGLGELDVLDGSPPCQGFSTAGNRILNDPRNQLFREYTRLLAGLRPKTFVMENVSGMVKGKMKLIFAECMRELKACGYRVSARLLDAMYFGVPQSRQRVIFIGIRDDLNAAPSHPKAQMRPISVAEAIELDGHGEFLTGFSAGERETFARPAPDVMKDGLGGSGHSQYKVISNSSYRETYKPITEPSPRSSATAPVASLMITSVPNDALALPPSRVKAYDGHDAYNFAIASANEPAPTLTIASPGNDLGHPTERRKFTIGEAKRLCSFPNSFEMTGSYAKQWARLGNSVPPLFMRAIAEHLRDHALMTRTERAG